jgi:hypothetical protein
VQLADPFSSSFCLFAMTPAPLLTCISLRTNGPVSHLAHGRPRLALSSSSTRPPLLCLQPRSHGLVGHSIQPHSESWTSTFIRDDSVALRAPPGTKTEWLARIAAANQALVYCLVTWFYLPSQLREVGIPTIGRPKVLKGEVYLSDHREVIETSTVDCECFLSFFHNSASNGRGCETSGWQRTPARRRTRTLTIYASSQRMSKSTFTPATSPRNPTTFIESRS